MPKALTITLAHFKLFRFIRVRMRQAKATMKDKAKNVPDAIVINEVQLILAEKRTSLASLRTGIAVFALPLTVLSFLIV